MSAINNVTPRVAPPALKVTSPTANAITPPPVNNGERPRPPQIDVRDNGRDFAQPGAMGTATVIHSILRSLGFTANSGAGGILAGFLAAFKAGFKTNVLVAAALSLATNMTDLFTGRINLKQFLGLTAVDGVAYATIGAAATAAGAVLAPLVLAAVPALAVVAPAIPVVIAAASGIGASWLYAKAAHEPLKSYLR
jgi:hypothetical protein